MRFYQDPSKLTFPEADRVVDEYLHEMAAQRKHTTTVAVLRWSEMPNTIHNRNRIHDALSRVCVVTDETWSGRTVFRLTNENDKL